MTRILVVDDDATVANFLALVLGLEGHEVVTVGSAEAALDQAHAGPFDLVTIDAGLPGMDGDQLSRRLVSDPATANIRQIAISGRPAVGRAASDWPAVAAVLTKPVEPSTLVRVVRDVLADLGPAPDPGLARELRAVLDRRLIRPVFQPIVNLTTGSIVAVEGLARGPAGPLQSPGALFAAANDSGLLHELDILCRLTAISAARDAFPLTPALVSVNAEPGTADLPLTPELLTLLSSDLPFQVVVEFTERALTHRAPALVRHAEEIRRRGNVVALDDVGVDPRSVALLPLLRPEIVKLDMSLVARALSREAAAAAAAGAAYAQRSGAVVIAEGIETVEQQDAAMALGAHWGQGYLYARPGPMADLAGRDVDRGRSRIEVRRAEGRPEDTPYGLAVSAGLERQEGDRGLLQHLSRALEARALALGELGVVMAALQEQARLSAGVRAVYASLAERAAVVALFGRGMAVEPIPGVHGGDLSAEDPLAQEWTVVVLGPHEAAALCARAVGHSSGFDSDLFTYVMTDEREVVEQIARSLARRLVPQPSRSRTTALR